MSSGRILAVFGVLCGVAAAIAFLLGVALDLYWLRILAKPIPALVLAVAVWTWGRWPDARSITVGLVLSAVGDIFLEVSAATFLYGVGAFLLAHVAYIFAFVGAAPEPRWLRAVPFAAWGAALTWWLAPGLESAEMLVPVAIYSAVICLMMWRASVRWADGTSTGKAAFLAHVEHLQAIARTNRRYGIYKDHGLIVDYIGVSKKLGEALSAYRKEDVASAMHDQDELSGGL